MAALRYDIMGTIVFETAISFGPDCRAKYQMDRVFGDATPSSVAAWQVTPRRAQRAYLSRRFEGLFELADLAVREGCVVNRRYRTRHPHEFPPDIEEGTLAAHYADARSRHDHLAAKTHKLLASDQRVLICLSRRYPPHQYWRLWLVARLAYPRSRFHLLNGPNDPTSQDGDGWRGSDAIWDGHFRNVLHSS